MCYQTKNFEIYVFQFKPVLLKNPPLIVRLWRLPFSQSERLAPREKTTLIKDFNRDYDTK